MFWQLPSCSMKTAGRAGGGAAGGRWESESTKSFLDAQAEAGATKERNMMDFFNTSSVVSIFLRIH